MTLKFGSICYLLNLQCTFLKTICWLNHKSMLSYQATSLICLVFLDNPTCSNILCYSICLYIPLGLCCVSFVGMLIILDWLVDTRATTTRAPSVWVLLFFIWFKELVFLLWPHFPLIFSSSLLRQVGAFSALWFWITIPFQHRLWLLKSWGGRNIVFDSWADRHIFVAWCHKPDVPFLRSWHIKLVHKEKSQGHALGVFDFKLWTCVVMLSWCVLV